MTKPKGIFILEPTFFETIYGPQERQEILELVDLPDRAFSPSEAVKFPELLHGIEYIFSGWGGPRLDRAFLEMVPSLKAFFYGAGSIKGCVTDELWEKNISITSALSANAVPVAEYAHAQIILSLKRVWWYTRELRHIKGWPRRSGCWANGAGGYGATVGIVALGVIGRMVCEKLKQNDVHVLAYDPLVDAECAKKFGAEIVSLDELFQRSDVVSLHAPWLQETEGMVDKRLLSMMKKEATLINTARGALIREADLIEILEERPDLFAVLDVTNPEPPEKESLLYSLPNVVLTPHIAGSAGNECRRMGRSMVEEMKRYIAGEPLLHQVDPKMVQISA